MKYKYIFLITCAATAYADFRPVQEQFQNSKDPHAINVSFNMGNSQEAPVANTATASPTQKIHHEHTMKSEPIPEQPLFSRIKNGIISGACTALGSAAAYKIMEHSGDIIEFIKKIVLRG